MGLVASMAIGIHDHTNSQPETLPVPHCIEKNGGDDETRTRDLCRDSSKSDVGGNEKE